MPEIPALNARAPKSPREFKACQGQVAVILRTGRAAVPRQSFALSHSSPRGQLMMSPPGRRDRGPRLLVCRFAKKQWAGRPRAEPITAKKAALDEPGKPLRIPSVIDECPFRRPCVRKPRDAVARLKFVDQRTGRRTFIDIGLTPRRPQLINRTVTLRKRI
jgi:hypothetical protein